MDILLFLNSLDVFVKVMRMNARAGGGGYCQIWAIKVFAAVKGMVFKKFTIG